MNTITAELLLDNLKSLDEKLLKAVKACDLTNFDLTVESIRETITQANNQVPTDDMKLAEEFPRGTTELKNELQTTFLGGVVDEMRAQLIKEAVESGLLPKIETKRVNVWSGPRNVSSALMTSFHQRADTQVYDEPLYGYYLKLQEERAKNHPRAKEVIGTMLSEGSRVVKEVILGPKVKEVAFFKQMTHHLFLTKMDRSFLLNGEVVNVLLTRNPRDMVPSHAKDIGIDKIDIHDVGYADEWTLFEELHSAGKTPLVIDGELLLENPKSVLTKLCDGIGIEFQESMLSWPKGPQGFHGHWGKYWYGNLVKSEGFGQYARREAPSELADLVAECTTYYNKLLEHAIRP